MYKIVSNIKGCKDIRDLRKFIAENEIMLVLFAETHGYLKEVPVQEKIISLINPDYFLYEMLEEKKILSSKQAKSFLNQPAKKTFSFISKYGELKPTIKMARNFNLPIIGCDIKNMCVRSSDWLSKGFSKKEAEHIRKTREIKQSKIINQYSKKGLVFASLGAYHLRRGSTTTNGLKEKKFILVYPVINDKPAFVTKSDPKNPKVKYKLKLVNKK